MKFAAPPTDVYPFGVQPHAGSADSREYVLMTAAYNEEASIAQTIESVIAQSILPKRWVIVSDASSDRTDEIVNAYAANHDFICFLRRSRAPGRSFGSKVSALQQGCKLLDDVDSEFIGNLDADVTIGPTYFQDLIARFDQNPRLGVVGGYVYEESNGEFRSRRGNRTYSIAHAGQFLRRECYRAIGGYVVLEYGGEDWHAQTSARMLGWEASAFPEIKILHHRHTGTGDNVVRHRFRQGRMDYSFGSRPLFETLKCLERLPDAPFLIGGFARLAGFFWSCILREKRPVSAEFMAFLRKEQTGKLASLFRGVH